MADLDKLKIAMGDLDEDTVNAILEEVMADGGGQAKEALDALQQGMATVGKRFEEEEYFIGDLIFSGDVMTNAVAIISPALAGAEGESAGKMILCTVQGDLHDIGKNIVKTVMEAAGFEVLDLGIDVPVDKILATAKEDGVGIVAMSGVLTTAVDSMKKTVDAFAAAGLRDKVKFLIGGAPVNQQVCEYVGADAWTLNPQSGVQHCLEWAKA